MILGFGNSYLWILGFILCYLGILEWRGREKDRGDRGEGGRQGWKEVELGREWIGGQGEG